jgi:hypothetical protein
VNKKTVDQERDVEPASRSGHIDRFIYTILLP